MYPKLTSASFTTGQNRPKPLPFFEQKLEVSRIKERTQVFDQLVQKAQVQRGALPPLNVNIQSRNKGITDVSYTYPNNGSVASNGRVYKIQPLLNFPKPVQADKTRDTLGYKLNSFHKILSNDRHQFLTHRDDKRNTRSVIDTRMDQGLSKPIKQ
jgi:hypothetical protein